MLSLFVASFLIAALHTVANPSHYLPFVALGKANSWGAFRSALAAAFCGLGHIVGFALFSFAGIILGEGIKREAGISENGELLGRVVFLFFGLCYCAYGLSFALRAGPEKSNCSCGCCLDCEKLREASRNPLKLKSFWVLFLIFCVSPCDAIVPLVFYPAVQENPLLGLCVVGGAFYTSTIVAMFALTFLIYKGISAFKFESEFFERWAHFITGIVITLSGLALFFIN